jgi:superfamily I DNA and/or RNA helicase/very-short-patch-repair endonuclease
MKLDKQFIEILKQKITIGNTRSILLNATPGRFATRLPLDELDKIEENLSNKFIDKLTSQTSFEIDFTILLENKNTDELKLLSKTEKRLNALKYDHDDYFKEHGVETFGLGFPIFLRKNIKDPTKYIAAPLFIFPLSVKKSYDKAKHWKISREIDSEIRLNEILISYLENEEHIKIPTISDEIIDEGMISKVEIETFCNKILQKFEGASFKKANWANFEPFPDKFKIGPNEQLATSIHWNGVLGLYKSQKQSQINEMESLLEKYEELSDRNFEFEWEHCHSPENIDPSQNLALRSLSKERDLVIQGPPGTGKSQTLTAIVSSAIANNKKVLIVCEKRTALEVLKKNLETLIPEISNSIALIEDVSKDRTKLVEIVRNKTARFLIINNSKEELNDTIARFEEKANIVESKYQNLRLPIWKNKKWKELVKDWISVERDEQEKKVLYGLQKQFLQNSIEEKDFTKLLNTIEDGSFIFKEVEEYYKEYDKIFLNQKNSNLNNLIFDFNQSKLELEELLKKNELIINKCLENEKIKNKKLIGKIKDDLSYHIKIADNWKHKGIDIYNLPKFILIRQLFNKELREAKKDSIIVLAFYNKLNIDWAKLFNKKFNSEYFENELDFLNSSAEKMLIDDFSKLFDSLSLQDNLGALSFEFESLKNDIDNLVQNLSKYIFQDFARFNSYKISTLKDEILEKLVFISKMVNDEYKVKSYFNWKSFCRDLNEDSLDWITKLISQNVKPEHWRKTLIDSRLYFKLITEDNNKFPNDSSTIDILKALRIDIQKLNKEVIKSNIENWFYLGQKKIKEKGLTINQVYNLRGAKGETRNSLRKIIHFNLESFTDFFPIVMLNPSVCSSLIPLKKGFFDVVIFDEASQLRIEDTFPSILKGKQVIVSGDSKQMPPSNYFESSSQLLDDDSDEEEINFDNAEDSIGNEFLKDNSKQMAYSESLLQFAIDSDFRQTYLEMHYRSQHPDLIMFSNVCFYGSRLVPMPEKNETIPIIFKRIDGLYENRQNIAEAKEIVRILKEEIDEKKSIGVATFNLNQRNLILDYINDERTVDESFRNKMDSFEKLGFFVKNLENIQGDEKDIILISTTFGLKSDNSFKMAFGPISQKNGHRLLNVIITRAKHQLYILTSIPGNRISEFRQRLEINRNVDGTTGLLAYLAYANAVSKGNYEEKNELLNFIKNKTSKGQSDGNYNYLGLTESPFEEEIANWLYEVVDKERIILQYKCGGFRIDMVVLPKSKESNLKLAIECDGAAYHSDELTWHYDLYRQEQLENNGFKFHRIWSTNWWRKPEEEFQKLLASINSLG